MKIVACSSFSNTPILLNVDAVDIFLSTYFAEDVELIMKREAAKTY
jgi:hypothetical protein